MNRKQVIEHFSELAEMMGKPFKTENTTHGVRLIYGGHSAVLPRHRQNMRTVESLERKLHVAATPLAF